MFVNLLGNATDAAPEGSDLTLTSTVLPTARPWPDPLLPGLAVYRYTTFTIDFRNMGVGQ